MQSRTIKPLKKAHSFGYARSHQEFTGYKNEISEKYSPWDRIVFRDGSMTLTSDPLLLHALESKFCCENLKLLQAIKGYFDNQDIFSKLLTFQLIVDSYLSLEGKHAVNISDKLKKPILEANKKFNPTNKRPSDLELTEISNSLMILAESINDLICKQFNSYKEAITTTGSPQTNKKLHINERSLSFTFSDTSGHIRNGSNHYKGSPNNVRKTTFDSAGIQEDPRPAILHLQQQRQETKDSKNKKSDTVECQCTIL